MRILAVVPEYPPHSGGGVLLYYHELLPALARAGARVEVLVAAPFSPPVTEYEADGVLVRSLSLESIRRQEAGFARFAVAPDLRRCLATAWAAHDHACADPGLDVIECTDWGLLAAPWLAGGERAVAITLHGSMGQIDWFDPRPGRELEGTLLRLLEPPVLRAAAALSTPGAPNAASWSALLGCEVEWAAPPLTLADVDAPATASRPARAGLVVGRIQRWKGPETLCEALSRLGQAAPEVQWVGRDMPWGPAPSASRHLAARYPSVWGPLVRPLGARPLAEVRRLQREAAFVVIPSTWDVFNYTSTEALAAGAVVICSDGAGAASLITDGVDGFVFPAGDAAALADRLARAQALTATERLEMGSRGRARVADACAPDRAAARALERYRRAIQAGSRALDPWTAAAVSPASGARATAPLEHLPLRSILAHAAGRLRGRLRRGRGQAGGEGC